jgi:hypothetical protein
VCVFSGVTRHNWCQKWDRWRNTSQYVGPSTDASWYLYLQLQKVCRQFPMPLHRAVQIKYRGTHVWYSARTMNRKSVLFYSKSVRNEGLPAVIVQCLDTMFNFNVVANLALSPDMWVVCMQILKFRCLAWNCCYQLTLKWVVPLWSFRLGTYICTTLHRLHTSVMRMKLWETEVKLN